MPHVFDMIAAMKTATGTNAEILLKPRKTLTLKQWRAAADKAAATGRMANTLAKALAKRFAKRWKFVVFRTPGGTESAGVVDIVAIRKDGRAPSVSGLKALDLFEIILIQVKGGSAGRPTPDDIARLKLVGARYRAHKIVLFEWQVKKRAGFHVLDCNDQWEPSGASEIFG